MKNEKQAQRISIALAICGILLLAAGAGMLVASVPAAGQEDARRARLQAGARRILYARCGHSVLRRMDAPAGWVGMTRKRVEETLEAEGGRWRMTGFAPGKIETTQTRDLLCPAHWVLMMDEKGETGVYRELDGERMTKVKAYTVEAADEEMRGKLRQGLAYDFVAGLGGSLGKHGLKVEGPGNSVPWRGILGCI